MPMDRSPASDAEARILARLLPLTGTEARAWAWYTVYLIPAHGKTARQLVEEGRADAVHDHLDHLVGGGDS